VDPILFTVPPLAVPYPVLKAEDIVGPKPPSRWWRIACFFGYHRKVEEVDSITGQCVTCKTQICWCGWC
jgi:hypothetical protein